MRSYETFTVLVRQYRIADLLSNFMYRGKVKSDESVLARIYNGAVMLPVFPEMESENLGVYTHQGFFEQNVT